MSGTPDIVATINGCPDGGALLPADPFTALRYHFGMLLGVDDFETDQAYHRGKHRLHNAWNHREGVVWGLGVSADNKSGEIRVEAGLALDPAGEELHLDAQACLSIGAWFDAHQNDAGFTPQPTGVGGGFQFDAHVEMSFHPCLTRQVPAMSEPCSGVAGDTAYSRVFETVEIHLLPGAVDKPKPPGLYHRLRLLVGLEPPTTDNAGNKVQADQDVLDAISAILAKPSAEQAAAYLDAFRKFAALDGIDLRPAADPDTQGGSLLFPAPDATPIVLANINGITITGQTGSWTLSAATIDTSVRKSHVATLAIEELLCGSLMSASAASADAGGPRIDPAQVTFAASTVTIPIAADLESASASPAAFSVTTFDDTTGWSVPLSVTTVSYVAGTPNTITLTVPAFATEKLTRLIVRGTGPQPLLGANHVPLAGTLGGPPGSANDGNDFVLMKVVS
jgi:hypothetical protein